MTFNFLQADLSLVILLRIGCGMCQRKRMPKRIDFAKQRREQGGSLSSAVRELTLMMEPIARQHGINLRATPMQLLSVRSKNFSKTLVRSDGTSPAVKLLGSMLPVK